LYSVEIVVTDYAIPELPAMMLPIVSIVIALLVISVRRRR
jgi:hypothetical protein